MLRLALQTMRARRHGFVGAFVALSLAVALVMACGILMDSGMRAVAPVQRYAATPVVVAADQTIRVRTGVGEDESVESFLLPEQARIPAALARRVADVDGVQAVIPDRSMPTTVATADANPIHTRCMSSNMRRVRAVHASCASARMRLMTPDCRPVQSSAGPGAAAQRNTSPSWRMSSSSPAHGRQPEMCDSMAI